MEQFYTLLTDIGKAKIANATTLQTKVKFTKILVGDSNGSYYEPTETQTKLRNKVWEGGIGNISIDKDNPNWVVLESVIPSNIGGFTIREVGIEDEEGDLVVIAKYPQTYKPKIEDGSTKDLIIKTILEVTNVDTITLKVDPTIVLTTKKDLIDSQKNLEEKIDKNFIKKQNKTTWQDININGSLETGDTETLKLHRPNVTDKILLEPFNDNFTKLDGVLSRLGAGNIKEFSNLSLTDIKESGVYLIHNLLNAPDTPPSYMRDYLVEVYKKGGGAYYPKVCSLGTGKMYSYSGNGYEDIPCTSHVQPQALYIDSINGNDDNKGDEAHPIKTWSCADSRIPKILTKTLEIHLVNVPSESYIELSGLSTFVPATTWTWLTINGHNTLINNLNILSCNFGASQWSIALQNMNINVTLNVVQSSTVNIINSKIRNLNVDNSVARCSNNTVSKYSADYRAFIQLDGHNHHEIQSSFGCSSTYGSLIYVNGTHPHGDVSEKHESFGGKVEYVN